MSGDEARDVDALFARHHGSLVRYLVRLTGDPDVASDIAQEAFVRMLEQDAPPAEPRPWLFRVATNLVRDVGRKARRHRELGTADRLRRAHSDPPPAPDRGVERTEAGRRVRAALRALSAREREALLMREEGFKHREIAEALGTTTGSIGTLLRRAIEKAAARLPVHEEMEW